MQRAWALQVALETTKEMHRFFCRVSELTYRKAMNKRVGTGVGKVERRKGPFSQSQPTSLHGLPDVLLGFTLISIAGLEKGSGIKER